MGNKNKMYMGMDFRLEVISNKELTVEGCTGVAEYGDDYIKLNAKKGSVTLFGKKLEIVSYTDAAILMRGTIERIEFCM